MVGHRRRQQHLVRIRVCPRAFIPAAAHNPFALRNGLRSLDNQCHGFFFSGDADQVDLVQQCAEAKDVRVRIGKARKHGGACEIDNSARVVLELHCIVVAADKQDLAALDSDGLGIGAPAGLIVWCVGHDAAIQPGFVPVEGVNAGVGEDEAGGLGGALVMSLRTARD